MKAYEARSVMFAIPAYDEKVGAATVLSVFESIGAFVNRKWEIGVEICAGNPAVHLARNWLVRRFLQSPCTDLFFLDADISAEPGAIIRMIEHPVDVVLGLYRSRRPTETYTFLGMEDGVFKEDPETGLYEIRGGPAGFMRIRRHVIERMVESLTPQEYFFDSFSTSNKIPLLFEFGTVGDNYAGEDIGFCLRWRAAGGRVWADPDILLHHTGSTRFSSNFKQSMLTKERRERLDDSEREKFDELVGSQSS